MQTLININLKIEGKRKINLKCLTFIHIDTEIWSLQSNITFLFTVDVRADFDGVHRNISDRVIFITLLKFWTLITVFKIVYFFYPLKLILFWIFFLYMTIYIHVIVYIAKS